MFINGKYVPDTCMGCICVHCEKKWTEECEQEGSCDKIATTECEFYEEISHETFMRLTVAAIMRGIDLNHPAIVTHTSLN